jgi:hypothetical protein
MVSVLFTAELKTSENGCNKNEIPQGIHVMGKKYKNHFLNQFH